MIRLFGSICGLIVFSATILVGLATDAEPGDLIPRAVEGMFCGMLMGLGAGWIGMHIVRDGADKKDDEVVEAPKRDVQPEASEAHAGDVTVVGG